MKSIVEEASSIAKAIENGWIRAGKPQEFTIRIFEEPEKGFLGITKKPAKVGLFYKELPVQAPTKQKEVRRQEKPQPTRHAPQQQQQRPQPRHERNQPQTHQAQPHKQTQPVTEHQESKQHKWTPEMVEGCKEWITTMMHIIREHNIPFTIEQKNYYINIKFAASVLPDRRKEQILFKHWSYLLLQAMRHKFKRGLRGFKIVITSPA